MGTVPVPGRKRVVKMLGLTIFLLVFSLSSSLPVKRQAEYEYEYEYEYEDILDEHGNVVYDYYEKQLISNGAINENTGPTGGTKIIPIVTKKKRTRKIKIKKNKACHKIFINQICFMKCGKRYSRC